MKIRIDKRNMVALLDAMLIKSAIQEAEIEALEAEGEQESGEAWRDRALGNARKAIAALTGTELEPCGLSPACGGHLSKEAVAMCREAMEGKGQIRLGHERFRSVIWNLEAGIATRDTKIEDLEREIERLKALPTIDHSNCVPRATGEFDAKEAVGRYQSKWMSPERSDEYLLDDAMEDLATEAFEAGRQSNAAPALPQKVHVIVLRQSDVIFQIFAYGDRLYAEQTMAKMDEPCSSLHEVEVCHTKGEEVVSMT